MENDKSKIDNDVLKYYELQADATKVLIKMIFFLNYGGIVATIAALVSPGIIIKKELLSICLLLFIVGLAFAIIIVIGLRQFSFKVFSKAVDTRNESNIDYSHFRNQIETLMKNSCWKSVIRICGIISLVLFIIGVVLGLMGLFKIRICVL